MMIDLYEIVFNGGKQNFSNDISKNRHYDSHLAKTIIKSEMYTLC